MRLPFEEKYRISQKFGENPDMYTKFLVKQPDGTTGPMRGHNGIDFAVPAGTKIVAPFAGTVVEVNFDPEGYGNYVKMESETQGSTFGHLDTVVVSVGYKLNEGDEIGLSGNTGYSTGPHLHWGWYSIPRDRSNGYGGYQDQYSQIASLLEDSVVVAPTSNPSAELKYTEEQYQTAMKDRETFWKQRDEANEKLAQANTELLAIKTRNTELETTNQQLILQVDQITRKNQSLYLALADKEKEDYTAISLGIAAMDELHRIKDDVNVAVKEKDAGKLFKALQNIADKIKSLFTFGKKVKEGKVTVSVTPDVLPSKSETI